MFRTNQVVAVTACLLFAFGSVAAAQSTCCCPQGSIQKKSPEESAEREKPYEVARPARSIAPRDLPELASAEAERSRDAAEVLSKLPARRMVPGERAIAVIPGVKKAAFGFGARWGRGLMTMRDEDGRWLPPSFIQITGGNIGFQLGLQSTDLVLIFTDEDAINALLRGKLTLNADASAAGGPWGRTLSAGVPILLNSGIWAYSSSKGLFAGVSLDGSAITIDDGSNARVYGKFISGDEILRYRRVEPQAAVAPFMNAIEHYSPSRNLNAGATTND
jgi:lipid-binding SYLF domain-containing protein